MSKNNEIPQNSEVANKIEEVETLDGEVEFTYTIDYLNGACAALTTMDDIDTAIMNKRDEQRVKRIRRKCLRIIDSCINEFYDELFESEEEDS